MFAFKPFPTLAWLMLAISCHAQAPWYEDRANLLFYKDAQDAPQPVKSPEDWARRVAHLRANMELVMGPLPAPSTGPLELKFGEDTPLRHYTRRHVTFSVDGDRVPGWLLIPDGASETDKRPAMICLPGSSKPGKDNPAGLTSRASMAYAHELAERGYVCLALDYPLLHNAEYPADPYALGFQSATMKGVVNHRRGVDLLQSLPYVDAENIGVIGHSLGGHNALFLAVFDARVKAIVSSCGFNVFAKHNGGDVRAWSSQYYMPRIKTVYGDDAAKIPFDFTEVLAALAPRAVFVNAPLHDEPDFEVSGVRDCFTAALPVYRTLFNAKDKLQVRYPDAGHDFPAAERQAAYAFLDRHLKPRAGELKLDSGLAASWDAIDQPTEKSAPKLGTGDFTLALWVNAAGPGDLVSHYDPAQRRGFHLTLKTNGGVTSNQSNERHLQFGIDDARQTEWRDCGRPGESLFAFALATHEGQLYAGTCEPGKGQTGRVYRHAGGQKWIDCGAPDGSNSVTSMAVFQGRLYVGTGKYRVAGSALPESENTTFGGRILRYEGGEKWTDCGQLPGTEAVGGFAIFKDRLYASSLYKPSGFFVYEGENRWTSLPVPQGLDAKTGVSGPKRVESLTAHDGHLYASSYDGGHVYRYDGAAWTDLGQLGDNTQTYSFAPYQGKLHVGTWRSGKVFRWEDAGAWTDVGRLGEELEVMGMLVHNGRLIAGTLPLAEVYQYEGGETWKKLARLDHTPDVTYRRAWTMAEHDGEVFCSTLPSGKVYAWSAGQQTAWGHSFPAGWHHITAVKTGQRLSLHVDGELVAQSPVSADKPYQLDHDQPLRLGNGANGPLQGQMAQVKIYQRALNAQEIEALAQERPAAR